MRETGLFSDDVGRLRVWQMKFRSSGFMVSFVCFFQTGILLQRHFTLWQKAATLRRAPLKHAFLLDFWYWDEVLGNILFPYYLAPSEQALDHITGKEIVIVDPPRAGLHSDVIAILLQQLPPRTL